MIVTKFVCKKELLKISKIVSNLTIMFLLVKILIFNSLNKVFKQKLFILIMQSIMDNYKNIKDRDSELWNIFQIEYIKELGKMI